MLSTMKNNRSLSFYQFSDERFQPDLTSAYTGGLASVAIANTFFVTVTTTTGFNAQYSETATRLQTLRTSDASRLDLTTSNQNARNTGVKRAWQYEQADIEMGGNGSVRWSKQDQAEILEHGKVRQKTMPDGKKDGPQGHHQKNVATHPEQQANPDNVKIYKTQEEHRQKGHGGDFHNESDGPMIDKDKMLRRTNAKRVIKNEVGGLGIAVAIGLGVGVAIGFAVTLARSGVSPESLKLAAIEGAKGGVEAGALAAVGYGIGRTIGEVASKAVEGVLTSLGVEITKNISKMVSMGVVGTLTIAVFSAYQFIKLKQQGIGTREALLKTGKQAMFSLSLLAVSIAAQGIWGGPAGMIVSVSIGIIMVSYTVIDSVQQRQFAEKIRVYTIDKCQPKFSY